jgi:Ca2+-binding RTX toxin-like protein
VVVAVLAIAAPAEASSCAYVGNSVAVYMPGSSDTAGLHRVGDAIYDNGAQCGAATVYNTDAIFVSDTSPNQDGNDIVNIDLSGGPFAPGVTNEGPNGVSEIEIVLVLGHGTNTTWVTGSSGDDNIHAGVTFGPNGITRGINLNAGAEQGKISDADITYEEANPPNPPYDEPIILDGGDGNDTLDASGGAGFDEGLLEPVTLIGGNGDDHLTGGGGSDTLYADPGNDVIDGGEAGPDTLTYQTSPGPVTVDLSKSGPQNTGAFGTDQITNIDTLIGSPYDDTLTGSDHGEVIQGGDGNDVLTGRGGNDTLDGGPGIDTASYSTPPAGVTQGVMVDLGIAGPQQTGGAGADTLTGIENLVGSPFADELTGDSQANTIVGGAGEDSLNGAGGDDHLDARDGAHDQVLCGPGNDSVDADQQGVDSIFTDCETTAFAPAPPPAEQPGGGSTGTGPPDTVAPVLDQLTLAPRSFSEMRTPPSGSRSNGARVSYRLSEAASVTFEIQRAVDGRRVGGRCAPPTTENRRARPCRRWARVRGTLVGSGVKGVNRMRFSGQLAGRWMRPGQYRLLATARDSAGNRSRPRTANFTIVRASALDAPLSS